MCRFRRFSAFLLSLSLFFITVCNPVCSSVIPASSQNEEPVVIIDPGHGGVDAGAIGIRGTREKDLNLIIAMELAERFREAGVPVLLTRTTDALVLREGEDVKGQRKQKDLFYF